MAALTVTLSARYVSGGCTYLAGPVRGHSASSTSSPELAARRLVGKLHPRRNVRAVRPLPSTDLLVERFEFTLDDEAAGV